MPIVPRARSTPQTSTNAVGAPQLGLARRGGGSGGNALAEIADELAREKRRTGEMVVLSGTADATSLRTQLIHGEGGFKFTRGLGAAESENDVRERFARGLDEIRKRMNGREQREAFEQFATQEAARFDADVTRHLGAQQAAYADETLAKSTEASFSAVAGAVAAGEVTVGPDGLNDLAVQQNASLAIGAIRTYAERYPERLGSAKSDWIQEATSQALTAMHETAIEGILARGDDETAAAYLDKHGDGIEGKARARLTELVSGATEVGDTQRSIDTLFSLSFDEDDARDPIGGRTIAEMERDALARADTLDDPERRREVRTGVKRRFQEAEQLLTRERSESMAAIVGELGESRRSFADVRKDPRWATLLPKQQGAITEWVANELNGQAAPSTDPRLYHDLSVMAAQDRASFAKYDLLTARLEGQLTEKDYRSFLDMQLEGPAGERGAKSKGLLSDLATVQRVWDAANPAELFDVDDDGPTAALKGQFELAVSEEVEVRRQRGEEPDIRAIAEAMLAESVVTDRSEFGDSALDFVFPVPRLVGRAISGPDQSTVRGFQLTEDDIALTEADGGGIVLTSLQRRRMRNAYRVTYGRDASDRELRRFTLQAIRSGEFTPGSR